MARPKKDEHNYHLNRQKAEQSQQDWLEAMVEAMPDPEPGTKTPSPAEAAKLRQIQADQQARDQYDAIKELMQPQSSSLGPNPKYWNMVNQGSYGTVRASHDAWNNGINTPSSSPTNPPTSSTPMHQAKYEIGQTVKLRRGVAPYEIREVWTNTEYREPVYLIRAVKSGRQEKIYEKDITLYEEPPTRPKVSFDSVIMADEKRQQILEALEQIHQSKLIFETWGFGSTIEKGKGVSMLFYGPPGTGKTLVCQAIADHLDYKLKVISTADIQSSAPGEAERNIRKHFKEAKGGKTILLFDECDSMIYTRAHVGPIMGAQINELLSQIERFDGITVFTTNRLGTLDEAVNRRLALKLEFAMPSPSERAEIWQRMFPKQAPLADDIDFMTLASIELTGGYIKNAVLRAARMAAIEPVADKDKKISMKHLVKALKLEASSMIEFEDARATHQRGFGRVVPNGNSNDLVRG